MKDVIGAIKLILNLSILNMTSVYSSWWRNGNMVYLSTLIGIFDYLNMYYRTMFILGPVNLET